MAGWFFLYVRIHNNIIILIGGRMRAGMVLVPSHISGMLCGNFLYFEFCEGHNVSLSPCRQKLWSSGGLDGLNSLWGGPLGTHEGHPEWVGGRHSPITDVKFCQNQFQISRGMPTAIVPFIWIQSGLKKCDGKIKDTVMMRIKSMAVTVQHPVVPPEQSSVLRRRIFRHGVHWGMSSKNYMAEEKNTNNNI